MPELIEAPVVIAAAGSPPKRIEEFVGRASTAGSGLSIARMVSPAGWAEPGQTPEFDEYTLVLAGTLVAESGDGMIEIGAGQALLVRAGEWVRYGTPSPEGAEYISVCVPAFSPELVHRDIGGQESRTGSCPRPWRA
jgi:mannose-6-phosphate isomerase-like protein (cupin superfamily)